MVTLRTITQKKTNKTKQNAGGTTLINFWEYSWDNQDDY